MKERNIPISQREYHVATPFTRFLWWLSTAEEEILIDSVIDKNRYRIIGMTVLTTWLFATFTWTYFFSTIVDSLWIAFPLGTFMGFIILTIDRALIKGITKNNRKKFMPILFRVLLAFTIGTFMAQPAVLYMFDKEIKTQISLDNEKRKMIKRQELDKLFAKRKTELMAQKETLTNELNAKYIDVSKAREAYISETDGSGGTGKIGIKDIAIAKRNEYQKLDIGYQSLLLANKEKTDLADKELNDIETSIKKEEAGFASNLNSGFLTRIEALSNLIKNNLPLQIRYYLVVFILMLIELMPVIAKSLLPGGSYDEKVMLREKMEIEMAQSNIEKEQALKMLYNQMAHTHDSEALKDFFKISQVHRTEKINLFSKNWKEQNDLSFDGLWEKMKKEILTKQEN